MKHPNNDENGDMGSSSAIAESYTRSHFKFNPNAPHIPTMTEGSRLATQMPSVSLPFHPVVETQNIFIPAYDIVRPKSPLEGSVRRALREQDMQSFDCASIQPVPIFQQSPDMRQPVMPLEGFETGVAREAGAQFKFYGHQYGPVIEPDVLDMSRPSCGWGNTGSIIVPSDNACDLIGQGAPPHLQYIVFLHEEKPVRVHRISPAALKEPHVGLWSLPSTDSRLDRPNQSCPSASPCLEEATGSGVVVQSDAQPPSFQPAEDKRSSSGLQRRGRGDKIEKRPYARRKPHAIYEINVEKLQDRCRQDGGDEGAVDHFPTIFKDGVSAEALSRQMTKEEIDQQVFGVWPRRTQVYRALLGQETQGSCVYHTCRLCREGTRWPYRNAKDVLQHIKRCHVGGCEGNKS